MPAWALKLAATLTTLLLLAGSFDYARTHLKNPAAPLQPPVAGVSPAPSASPTPLPPLVPRRGARGSATPAPALTLVPEVKRTQAPAVTFTYVS